MKVNTKSVVMSRLQPDTLFSKFVTVFILSYSYGLCTCHILNFPKHIHSFCPFTIEKAKSREFNKLT